MNTTAHETASALLAKIESRHVLVPTVRCNAKSVPIEHEHSNHCVEVKSMTCTETEPHTIHRDAMCCWRFQSFTEEQVAEHVPRTLWVHCLCGSSSGLDMARNPCDALTLAAALRAALELTTNDVDARIAEVLAGTRSVLKDET